MYIVSIENKGNIKIFRHLLSLEISKKKFRKRIDYSAVHEVESNYSIVVVKYFYQLFIIYRIWESLDGDYSGGKQECQV